MCGIHNLPIREVIEIMRRLYPEIALTVRDVGNVRLQQRQDTIGTHSATQQFVRALKGERANAELVLRHQLVPQCDKTEYQGYPNQREGRQMLGLW